ncbi:MAG: ABC transporter permease [Candidatus Adiutrix sp.]|jgi:putative ABC transport system permease protein|nr:ABC transporter permease [Candidatus Adiutrix sp.]
MFWKMLNGALVRRKGKLVMIAFAVGLGVSLATAMLNVMFDVGDKVNQELKTYGANLTVVPRGASLMDELYSLEGDSAEPPRAEKYIAEADLHKIKMIFWAYNIVDFAPYLETAVKGGGQEISLVGTWFNKHLELPTGDEVDAGMNGLKTWWDIRGQGGDDADETGVLVGEALALRLGLGPGDSFPIESLDGQVGATVKIRGVFHSGGVEDEQIFAPLKLSQDLSGRPGLVQKVEVSALTTPENDLARRAAQDPGSLSRMEWDTWYCTAYISSIAYQIEEIIPGTRVKPVLQVAESEGAILEKTQLLMLLLTVLAMACSALAISNLVTANVMERSAEIGLLKALGATNSAISILMLTEILITAFIGGALGYFAGLGFAQLIGHGVFDSAVEVKGLVIPLTVVLVFLVTALGSLPAVRMLLRLRPTEVLHGR